MKIVELLENDRQVGYYLRLKESRWSKAELYGDQHHISCLLNGPQKRKQHYTAKLSKR